MDPTRGTVSRVPADACPGGPLSAAEAEGIEARRAQVARAIVAAPRSAGPGRLAGVGSGFAVGPGGEVMTNHHVIDGCAALTVFAPGRGRHVALALASDAEADLAVLRAGTRAETWARFSAAPGRARSLHGAVVGFPAIGAPTVLATLTAVHAGDPTQAPVFPLGGPIRHGHSGSPVLDQSGLVIGVVRGRIDRADGGSDVGIAVAPAAAMDLLARAGVKADRAEPGDPAGDDVLLAEARRWTWRVECWR
ncbi:S1 family peptidase [Arenibaculum pallidiluteum]|uniref:S1 family peptidase n=1 Tax=Arenibaculum pallidiluteum TaxID=2812559 RepID=UPI001A97A6EF|nr:serine protease [Arenibaculum pallidiluteum]